ncbi:MAG: DUF3817 domain-containing protein [Microthrixaceae bacterium]
MSSQKVNLLIYFRVVAIVEALSYLCLLSASVAHRIGNTQDLVPQIGLVHGVIFLVYLGLALSVRNTLRWNLASTVFVIIAAVIPCGGIYVERNYSKLQE